MEDNAPPPAFFESESDSEHEVEVDPIPNPHDDVLDEPPVLDGPQGVIVLAPAPPPLPADMVDRGVFDEMARQCSQLRGRTTALQSVVDALTRDAPIPLLAASAGVRIRAMVRSATYELQHLNMVDEGHRADYLEELVRVLMDELRRLLEG